MNKYVECKTQKEFDKAIKDGDIPVVREGYWEVTDSATVRAYDSATVRAYDSATVRAYDSATVTATGSATVTATGSATVTAYGSATVTATGSATVTAYGSATVTAYDSATVTAGDRVAVHKLSKAAKITGGVIIERPDLRDTQGWLEYHGIPITKSGKVVLFKAVDDNFKSGYGWDYSPGSKPVPEKWIPENSCGDGLHLCPTPFHALRCMNEATRFVACTVAVADIVTITEYDGSSDKCKVAKILKCVEVDIEGKAK